MLVDPFYRRCVAYVMMDLPDGGDVKRTPAGTAFFVAHPVSRNESIIYAVTAGHVIEAGEVKGAKGLALRVAPYGGREFKDIPMSSESWEKHPGSDVAVARLPGIPEDVQIQTYPIESLAIKEILEGRRPPVGEGDEVFFVGLFHRFPGEQQILPVARFGNIALMPYEPVMARTSVRQDAPSKPISAYLVEARSWGGHSGSPAWVYFPTTRTPSESLTWNDLGATQPLLLGLVQGHYAIDPHEDFIGDLAHERSLAANAGIAIVVPAEHILEVIRGEALSKDRQQIEDEIRRERQLTRAVVQTPKARAGRGLALSGDSASANRGPTIGATTAASTRQWCWRPHPLLPTGPWIVSSRARRCSPQ